MLAAVIEHLYILNTSLTIIGIVVIILSNKESEASIAWILMILALPVLGLSLYILIGVDWRRFKLVPQLPEEFFAEHLGRVIHQQIDYIKSSEIGEDDSFSDAVKNMNLLLNSNQVPLTLDNRLRFYFSGKEHFADLLRDLAGAEKTIHMEYFIWKSDALGERIKEILLERARKGVEIKLIFDGLGSFGRISFRYRRELREAGVQFSYFLDLNRFIARLKINYSNHRKIVVIDGKIAYTGGMNIGEEYISGGPSFPSWRDTHVRLTGGAVTILQTIFLTDWFNCKNEMLIKEDFFPEQTADMLEVPIQIAVSGPDSKWDSIELLYFNMITNAKHEVLIQSPYFVPDQATVKAMESAALSGVKVVLMMTGHPDKRIAWWTAFTYFRPLLEAGVTILHYKRGFLHCKMMVMDGHVSTIGTCNMDIRSFRLNYEVNAVFYDTDAAERLTRQFEEDRKACRRITLEEVEGIPILQRFRNSFCRIFAPLM